MIQWLCKLFGGHKWILLYQGHEGESRMCDYCGKVQYNYGFKGKWEDCPRHKEGM